MMRIYVRKPGEKAGRVYKHKSSIVNDVVAVLSYDFVRRGLITEKEWATSREKIAAKFELLIIEKRCDGRMKRVKYYKPFCWADVINVKNVKN